MQQRRQHRTPRRRFPLGRMAGAILAVGGVSALLATDVAGAASSVVSTTKSTKYGTILVSGKTVYTLKASKTACGAACLKVWPELVLPTGVTAATAGSGVNAAKLGTVALPGGVLQVTYAGKPLYLFYKDTKPGQVKGAVTDKWGKWSVVVTVKPTGSGAGSSSNSGSGGSTAGSGGVSF
jgi:predicted lipoprotein with Yx(FWY)xxD motif